MFPLSRKHFCMVRKCFQSLENISIWLENGFILSKMFPLSRKHFRMVRKYFQSLENISVWSENVFTLLKMFPLSRKHFCMVRKCFHSLENVFTLLKMFLLSWKHFSLTVGSSNTELTHIYYKWYQRAALWEPKANWYNTCLEKTLKPEWE